MKETKKEILEILKKQSKKPIKYENLVVNLALQKLNTDKFEFRRQDGVQCRQDHPYICSGQ